MYADTSLDINPSKYALYGLCANSCAFPSWPNYGNTLHNQSHSKSFMPDTEILQVCGDRCNHRVVNHASPLQRRTTEQAFPRQGGGAYMRIRLPKYPRRFEMRTAKTRGQPIVPLRT